MTLLEEFALYGQAPTLAHDTAPILLATATAGLASWAATWAVLRITRRRDAAAWYRSATSDERGHGAERIGDDQSDDLTPALADEIAIGLHAIDQYLRKESGR